VQANRANGQWWLLNAYSQMSGQTVEVTPPHPGQSYTLQGVATLDEDLKQSRVILGGAGGDYTLRLGNVPTDVFGDTVHVAVREIGWSGQIGDSAQPDTIAELDVPAADAAVHFGAGDLPELNAESSYEVIVTPGTDTGAAAEPRTTWEVTYEAEDAEFQGTGLTVNGPEGSPSDVGKFYTSGGYNVGGMRTGTDNGLRFTVDVPETGEYDLSVFAGSLNTDPEVQAQGPTNMFLSVDGGAEQEVFLPLGYKWTVWDHTDTTVALTAGEHVITLATKSLTGDGAITGDVLVDKIDLSLPNPEHENDVYEAEYAELEGAAPVYGSDSGASIPKGATATFWVYSPADAAALLDLDTARKGKVQLEVNGETVTTAKDGTVDAFLLGGVNKIVVKGAKHLQVDRLTVAPSEALDSQAFEAEDGTLAGTATAQDFSLASGGQAVTGVGGEPGNDNTLTFDAVEVPEAGKYALTIRYSNEEQSPATHYNPDPVARYALVSINGAEPIRVIFPHSFHENNFWELTVVVDLEEGVNEIDVNGEEKPQFDGTSYSSDVWPDVLLRSQYAPNLDRITLTPLFG
jgi:hypothetical protein